MSYLVLQYARCSELQKLESMHARNYHGKI